ncbi:MAG: sigma-70 family RNA polymerase sigma factor [Ignavibacteria bacterium]|jgi:RNA polymerase sigma-70 factor (ECF subfamily)
MHDDVPDRTKELVKLIIEDNHSAFREFYNLLYPRIYGFIFRSTFDKILTEEICQETFINFWEARESISVEKYSNAYLFKIAKNLLINSLERTKKMFSLQSSEYIDSIRAERVNENMLEYDLKQAVLKLPERCRIIFILNRYQRFRYSEIAEILDISIQTVKNQMSKSIKILRKYLNN